MGGEGVIFFDTHERTKEPAARGEGDEKGSAWPLARTLHSGVDQYAPKRVASGFVQPFGKSCLLILLWGRLLVLIGARERFLHP